MVREANEHDANELLKLNDELNGIGETTVNHIKNSLRNNQQEIVVVALEENEIVGFTCIQIKQSLCYENYVPEITEVYVKPEFRGKGYASKMVAFSEELSKEKFPIKRIELLTGKDNKVAKIMYDKLGFIDDNKLHLTKK